MKKSYFSENELNYLKSPRDMNQKYSKNYIYNIRYSIKQKVIVFLRDIEMFLNPTNMNSISIFLDGNDRSGWECISKLRKLAIVIVSKIMIKIYPFHINEIFQIKDIEKHIDSKPLIDNFIQRLQEIKEKKNFI